ncbi:CCA tRNA nucleotidyltransferase [bacterium]|nr:MAG: CCA tRNA nucleotidyltransferase [bacterium]
MSRSKAATPRKLKIAARKGRRIPAFSFSTALPLLRRDPIIKAVAGFGAKSSGDVFLVGGVLRNISLSLKLPLDYDFVVSGGQAAARLLAKKMAGCFDASAFVIDKESGGHRVVIKEPSGRITVDITPLNGVSIRQDLKSRDFTINALAVNLKDLFNQSVTPIDPCKGLADAQLNILRAVSRRVFDDDPLRVMRAVRLSQQYGLKVERETAARIKKKAAFLSSVSAERIREELLTMFSLDGTSGSVIKMYDLGIIKAFAPELAGWKNVGGYGLLEYSIKALDEAERLVNGISEKTFPGAFQELKTHFSSSVGPVKRAALFKLSAFLHDTGKALTISREEGVLRFTGHDKKGAEAVRVLLKRLRFGGGAVRLIAGLTENHHRVFDFARLKNPSFRAKAHLMRSAQMQGCGGAVDLLCLSLSDARATRGSEDKKLLGIVRGLILFYYGVFSKETPGPVLDGREIMKVFNIGEGRLIGEMMRIIDKGVEAGVIKNKKDAIACAKKLLKDAD